MTAEHHLDDATLLRYASGDLDEAFAVVTAAHIAMCDDCRRAVRAAEEVGGETLAATEATPMATGAFDQVMRKLGGTAADIAVVHPQKPKARDTEVPAPLARYIGPHLDAVRWRTVAPGVRKYELQQQTESGSSLFMLYIAPGVAVPEHSHGGTELTLILKGAYRDALGRFARGDIADLDEHIEHQPVVDGDEACICLVATEAPTRFKGIVGRLLQPFVGI